MSKATRFHQYIQAPWANSSSRTRQRPRPDTKSIHHLQALKVPGTGGHSWEDVACWHCLCLLGCRPFLTSPKCIFPGNLSTLKLLLGWERAHDSSFLTSGCVCSVYLQRVFEHREQANDASAYFPAQSSYVKMVIPQSSVHKLAPRKPNLHF